MNDGSFRITVIRVVTQLTVVLSERPLESSSIFENLIGIIILKKSKKGVNT